MKIKLSLVIFFTLIILNLSHVLTASDNIDVQKPELRFNPNGSFKLLQLSDIHAGPKLDKRTSNLIVRILDSEKPNFVVITGDIIDGKCKTKRDVKRAIKNIATLIERKGYPWCVTFGNHDDEHNQMSKDEMMKLYMSYPKNISQLGPKDISGVGNYNLLVKGSKGDSPMLNFYMLDSGTYAPINIGGYSWIKFDQINWYRNTADELSKTFKKEIPSLLFTHIPLPEFKLLWDTGKVTGARNEGESSPKINSGLFCSLLEMKDVKGVFVGHDHINDYYGDYYGITLGYCRSTGHSTYGLEGFAKGARVFQFREEDPTKFDTWVRTEDDFNN